MSATAIPVHPRLKGRWHETEGNNFFSATDRMLAWLKSASVGTARGRDEQRVWRDEFHKDEKMKLILELALKLYLTAEWVNDSKGRGLGGEQPEWRFKQN